MVRTCASLRAWKFCLFYHWQMHSFCINGIWTLFLNTTLVSPYYHDLEDISLFWCRWISLAFLTLQLSSWLLSLVSFDRVMIVYSNSWKHQMGKPKRIYSLILSIVVLLILSNLHILIYNGYVIETNETKSNNFSLVQLNTKKVVCYESINDKNYIFPKWERAHLFIYNAIPFAIMLICNSLIIYNIKFARKVQSKTKASNKRKRRMTFMLILVTFSFILLTLPSVIVHTFYREYLKNKPYRRLVNIIVNNLLHTSHAINFLYIFSAPNFRAEIKKMLTDLYLKIKNSNNDFNSNNSTLRASNRATRTYKSIKNIKQEINNKNNNDAHINDLSNLLANENNKNEIEMSKRSKNWKFFISLF